MKSSDDTKQGLFLAPYKPANNHLGQPDPFPAIHEDDARRK
jgi:hypothetical protein